MANNLAENNHIKSIFEIKIANPLVSDTFIDEVSDVINNKGNSKHIIKVSGVSNIYAGTPINGEVSTVKRRVILEHFRKDSSHMNSIEEWAVFASKINQPVAIVPNGDDKWKVFLDKSDERGQLMAAVRVVKTNSPGKLVVNVIKTAFYRAEYIKDINKEGTIKINQTGLQRHQSPSDLLSLSGSTEILNQSDIEVNADDPAFCPKLSTV